VCSMLQCVVVCCSVSQCVAVRCMYGVTFFCFDSCIYGAKVRATARVRASPLEKQQTRDKARGRERDRRGGGGGRKGVRKGGGARGNDCECVKIQGGEDP